MTPITIPDSVLARLPIPSKAAHIIFNAEGLRTSAYLCPAGKWTIGVGHTGRDVAPGLIWTEPQIWRAFVTDVRGFAERVAELTGRQMTANQHGALTSFAFNLGTAALAGSTLLKRHKARRFKDAAAEFLRWNKARNEAGELVPLAGLTKRRAAESALYLEPDK